jgi:cytochrome P450
MPALNVNELPRLPDCPSYEEYAAARKISWLATSERGFEVLTHDNGWAVLSGEQFDNGGGFGKHILDKLGITEGTYREAWDKIIISLDGEPRERMRKPLRHLFKPHHVAKLQSVVRGLVNDILDEVNNPRDVDFMREIATRLPTLLYCHLISAPRELESTIFRITNSILPPLLTFNKARFKESEDAYMEGIAFMRAHIDARRKNLGDDFTSELIRCELDGMMSEDETMSIAMALLQASMDNTYHQMGLIFGTLLEDRSRWEQVVAKPDRAHQATEECMRLCPKFNLITRHAPVDIVVNDFTFPADSWVHVNVRSAGRDETKFDDSNSYRLGRPPTLQFGGSRYGCLGANVARLEFRELVGIVAERYPKIRLIGEWKKTVTRITTECEHLRVSLV